MVDLDEPRLVADVEALSAGPYLAGWRLCLDLGMWVGAAKVALAIGGPIPAAIAMIFIGFAPLHDLLVLGHEGTHDLISRHRWLNEAVSWLAFAPVGLSRAAHRELHHTHHRSPHQEGDPELAVFRRVAKDVPGWAYLFIPFVATAGINLYPFRRGAPAGPRGWVAIDLALIAVLHAALVFTLGPMIYLTFIVGPMATGLVVASVARTICEHHALPEGDPWTNARSVRSNALLGFLWSNVNYHLEHHLFPGVPFHRLPALRRRLAEMEPALARPAGRGYLLTTWALLREREHFKS